MYELAIDRLWVQQHVRNVSRLPSHGPGRSYLRRRLNEVGDRELLLSQVDCRSSWYCDDYTGETAMERVW